MLNVVVRLCTSLQQDQRLDGQGMYHLCTDISDIQELLPGNVGGGNDESCHALNDFGLLEKEF